MVCSATSRVPPFRVFESTWCDRERLGLGRWTLNKIAASFCSYIDALPFSWFSFQPCLIEKRPTQWKDMRLVCVSSLSWAHQCWGKTPRPMQFTCKLLKAQITYSDPRFHTGPVTESPYFITPLKQTTSRRSPMGDVRVGLI
jgi:hypothetical protein